MHRSRASDRGGEKNKEEGDQWGPGRGGGTAPAAFEARKLLKVQEVLQAAPQKLQPGFTIKYKSESWSFYYYSGHLYATSLL